MDLLKKELERKRKALAAAKSKAPQSTAELRRQQELVEESLKKNSSDKKKESTVSKVSQKGDSEKKKSNNVAESNVRLEASCGVGDGTAEDVNADGGGDSPDSPSKTEDILRRNLRAWGLPIRLFAESREDLQSRYETARRIAAKNELAVAEADEFRLHAGHGMRNRFLEKDTQQENGDEKDGPTEPSAKKRKVHELDASTLQDPHKLIYRYLKNILIQWEDDLNSRPDYEKSSIAGKKDTRTYQQCKDYIKPLFQLCKKRSIEPAMLSKLESIIRFMQQTEFVKAHDAYMDLAIGRAAWPIGVTMVGIHARSGRAKIESSNVAHVMNSELQRKYLTSVKRLMTYQQEKHSDVAPSKKVG